MKRPVIVDTTAPGLLTVGLPGAAAPLQQLETSVSVHESVEALVVELLGALPAIERAVPGVDSLVVTLPSSYCSLWSAQYLRESLARRSRPYAVRCLSTASALLFARGYCTGCVWEGRVVSTVFEGGLFQCSSQETPGIFDGSEISQFQIKALLVPAGKQFDGPKKLKHTEYDPLLDGFVGASALSSLAAWENADDTDALL